MDEHRGIVEPRLAPQHDAAAPPCPFASNAATPASDTSIHFGSGATSVAYWSCQRHHW